MTYRNLLVLSCALACVIVACGSDSTNDPGSGGAGGVAGKGGTSGASGSSGTNGSAGAAAGGGAAGTSATGGAGGACVPGTAQGCTCTNGAQGAQTCNPSGTGFEPCVCTGGTGGISGAAGRGGTGGSAGVGGTGGSGGCGNTATDPNNCGTCGNVCRGTCVSGKCAPAFGGCFARENFDTCNAFCASIGEVCVAGQCKGYTWMSWGPGSENICGLATAHNDGNQGAVCATTLPPREGTHVIFNCCCTE